MDSPEIQPMLKPKSVSKQAAAADYSKKRKLILFLRISLIFVVTEIDYQIIY